MVTSVIKVLKGSTVSVAVDSDSSCTGNARVWVIMDRQEATHIFSLLDAITAFNLCEKHSKLDFILDDDVANNRFSIIRFFHSAC